MWDFVNVVINNKETAEGLLNTPRLSFSTKVQSRTGKPLDGIHEAAHGNMIFIVYPNGRIELKGSIHKYYNFIATGKDRNHDCFTYSKVEFIIDYLHTTYGIQPNEAQIHGFEYAFNVMPRDFETVFKSFIAYKQWRFNRMTSETECQGWECPTSKHKLKIYNKGLHLGLPYPILRFEKKIIKMQAVKNVFPQGLKLIDLQNPFVWNMCKKSLLESLNDCIVSDYINTSKLSHKDRKTFTQGENVRSWESLERNKRYRLRKHYNSIILKHGSQKIKSQLSDLMESEFKRMAVPKIQREQGKPQSTKK